MYTRKEVTVKNIRGISNWSLLSKTPLKRNEQSIWWHRSAPAEHILCNCKELDRLRPLGKGIQTPEEIHTVAHKLILGFVKNLGLDRSE